MEYQQLIPLITFSIVSSISPGPNNIMLMTSGANVGFIRTIPHMLGITLGFSLMVVLVGFGLIELFTAYPIMQQSLRIASMLYLLYLAVKIAKSKPMTNDASDYKPMSFLSAASFQWVNPKAWTMALTAISVYAASAELRDILLVSLIFGLVNVPSVSLWTTAGKQLQGILQAPAKIKVFNYSMAGLLVLSIVPMI
ncbi:LysE family translocator [Moritella viscosa]|uniref:Transporter, LysE family n=2 Tax=Moritella viscosa TaxID=80854 RepID=A0A090IBG0_9GAMM|nr:LysE family translocator [Moritella viscosa]CED59141.1 transporter, LysE family [Moritella viscosa]SGY87043.1 Transporter, LysE family [Moritella viscosa]SGZ07544.1 Transporter, LysE family [Moritella viscosa]SHN99432.1 Transporter, LysE family [Moritella viscosa]SHN99433.1 Transporter, LysE family [Moritella viscosa]